MVENDGVVRSISWRDLCPWTLLFRVFRLSISLQPLVLALLGATLCSLGWWLIGVVLLSEESRQEASIGAFQANVVHWPDRFSFTSADELSHAGSSRAETPVPPPAVSPSPTPETPTPETPTPETPTNESPANESSQSSIAPPSTPAFSAAAEDVSPTPPTTSAETAADERLSSARPGHLPADASVMTRVWHQGLGRSPFYSIVEPMRGWLVPGITWDQRGYYLLGGLWTMAVWSWIGGAITRIASVRLGRDERVGLRESLEFARRKWLSFLGAPLLPLTGMLLLMIPLMLLGLFMRLNFGVAVAGVIWVLIGILGFVLALFAIGLLFGWPLMWATISTEGSDAFDGISRSYAYTYQKPLHYLAYALFAGLLGLLGWLLVDLFCETVLQLIYLAVSMGAGAARVDEIRATLLEANDSQSSLVWFGATLISGTNRIFRGFLRAYAFSYLWVAASAIYLLLRHDADQTEIDDVFLEEDDQATYGLPRMQPDEAGVPGVAADESDEETAE